MCEVGGGNGKLLFCLEKMGLLEKGISYEVSKNRCDLAAKFARLASSRVVEIRNCNFLEDKVWENEFDCIIMVDIVLQIISPLYDLAESDAVQWVRRALKKDGCLFAEIVDYSEILKRIGKEGDLRTWVEFPKEDPFQYSLNKFSIDKDDNLVVEKNFIGRNGSTRDYFKNVIRPYTPDGLAGILSSNGFNVSIYSCYDTAQFGEERNNTYRILAKKL